MHAQLNQTPSLRQAAIRGPGLGGGLRRYRPALVYVLCPADQQRSAYYHHGRSSRPPPWVVLDEGKRMGGAAGGYVDCDGQHCAGGCRYQDSRQQRQEPPPPHGLTPQETNYPTPAQPDTADDQGQASVVHRGRAAFVGRLRDGDERQRDQGDRHVDPEDRPPGPLDQVPARDRADRGQAADNAEEQGQSPAARVQVERHHETMAGLQPPPELLSARRKSLLALDILVVRGGVEVAHRRNIDISAAGLDSRRCQLGQARVERAPAQGRRKTRKRTG